MACAERCALEIVHAATSGTDVAPAEAAQRARTANEGQLGPALARYHEHNRTRGLRTHAGREAHGKLLEQVLGADRALASLVRKRLRDDGAAPATCNRYLATIKHFARWAEEIDATMPADVAAHLRKVRPMREPPGRVRHVKADEKSTFAKLAGWLQPVVDAPPASREVAPGIPSRRRRAETRTPRTAKIQGVSSMGHLGLEPRANGLRVRCSTN